MRLADPLDRARKLLALAGSPNVHEAAAAAARAQALITRHRLEHLAAEDADPVTDGAEAPLHTARKLRTWRVVLASELARVNGCVAYTLDRGPSQQILLAGRAGNRRAVAALWDPLVAQIQWLSATAGEGQPREWHEAFRVGAAEAVAERLGAGAAAMEAAALVALADRDQAVARWVAEKLRLKPGRGLRLDAQAYDAGQAAGRALPLADGKRRNR